MRNITSTATLDEIQFRSKEEKDRIFLAQKQAPQSENHCSSPMSAYLRVSHTRGEHLFCIKIVQ